MISSAPPAFLPCNPFSLKSTPHRPATPRSRRQATTMKRKRPSKPTSSSPPPSPSPSSGTPPPARITPSTSVLSLKRQLELARRVAAAEAASSATAEEPTKPRVRTRFRRRKSSFDGLAEGGSGVDGPRRRARKATEADIPEGKYELLGLAPIMLIDAYNVVGAWSKFAKLRNRGELSSARDRLLEEVLEFSSVRGWSCEVVWDAQGNAGAERAAKALKGSGVAVIYTGNETADAWIERRVFELCEAGERQVWVTTNDVAERRFVESKGAHVMSCSLFVQEVKRSKKDSREFAEEKQRSDESIIAGKMLIRNVDQDTRDKLYKLRALLDE